jgi:hypothetical protein
VEHLFKPALDQPLPEPLDRSGSTRERLRNSFIGPIRSFSIGLQKNLGTLNLLSCPLQFLHHDSKFIPLLIHQSHDIFLLHGTPPCAMQHRRSDPICQPDVFVVTKH